MTLRIVLEFDPETNGYSAVCPELPGCASAGETESDARTNIEEAIRLYLSPSDIDGPAGRETRRGHDWVNAASRD